MSDPAASPCVGVCHMDPVSGWCEGCLRTLDEIAVWSLLDEAEKKEVCASLVLRQLPSEQPAPQSGGSSV